MPNEEVERALQAIGQILAEDTCYPLDGTLLHAQVAADMVGPSIFKDRGNSILYNDGSDRLFYALLDLWSLWNEDKRWAEMEYVVRDGKFDVFFIYEDQIDYAEEELMRRDSIVRKYFGDKPIVYPPIGAPDESSTMEP